MENIKYMVWVSCMTFNQATYIEDAMNGFCMQETNFPFVCTIIDDASTDGEQEVIKNYLKAHFDLEDSTVVRNEDTVDYYLTFAQHKTNKNCYFAVLFLKYNHYSIKKPKAPYIEERCDTKYKSICEGDDYWIDPLKLQKQVDFMEAHPDYGLCYTKAKVYNQMNEKYEDNTIGWPFSSYNNMLLKNPVITLTTLFKTRLYLDYGSEIMPYSSGWKMGDYPLWLFIATKTKIHFIDEVTAVYRMSIGSMSRPAELGKKIAYIESMRDIRLFFLKKYKTGRKGLEKIIHKSCVHKVAQTCLECGETKKAFNYIKEYSGRINKFALYSQCIIKIIKKNVYSFYRKVFH